MKAIFSSLVVLSLGAIPASAAGLEAIYKGTTGPGTFTNANGDTFPTSGGGNFEADFFYDTSIGTVSPDGLTFTGLQFNESALFFEEPLGAENSFSTSIIKGPFTSTITTSISGLDGSVTLNLSTDFPGLIPGSVEVPFGTVLGSGSGSYTDVVTDNGLNTYVSGTLLTTSVEVIDLSPPPPPPVSTVPLPAGLPLFSVALLGLGGLGYSMKRNGKAGRPA